MKIISIKNLCKNYKSVKALDNLSLEINQGELFGLLGVNGAGKTSLIKIISTIIFTKEVCFYTIYTTFSAPSSRMRP